MKRVIRFILGYIAGISVFILLIPYGLFLLAGIDPLYRAGYNEHLALRLILSLPFFAAGTFFMAWSNIALVLTGKGGPTEGFNVEISPRTTKLVTSGPYRYTRNPMVLGAFLLYISGAVYLLSIVALAAIVVLYFIMQNYLKRSEEKRLTRDFGSNYESYRQNVPMILPFRITPRVKNRNGQP